MKNNYFIIHGSFSNEQGNWFPWLASSLRGGGGDTYVPCFPTGVGVQNFANWERLLMAYYKAGLINEHTTIVAHSIGPVAISKFLVKHGINVKKLIFVCGFNNYYFDKDFDAVNKSMYFKNLKDVKQHAKEIVCFYSDNDPYVKYEVEKEFADTVATKQIVLKGAGHINSEFGYTKFEEVLKYIK